MDEFKLFSVHKCVNICLHFNNVAMYSWSPSYGRYIDCCQQSGAKTIRQIVMHNKQQGNHKPGGMKKILSKHFQVYLNVNSALGQIWSALAEEGQQKAKVAAGISTSRKKTSNVTTIEKEKGKRQGRYNNLTAMCVSASSMVMFRGSIEQVMKILENVIKVRFFTRETQQQKTASRC